MSVSSTTTPASRPQAADPRTLWRGAMYEALAIAFSYPQAEAVEDLAVDLETLRDHELTRSSGLRPGVEALREALAASTLDTLATTHNRLFAGEVPCSPCETAYEFDGFAKARQLADIAGFYRAFGLKVAAHEAAPADFIATELDFLCHLAVKEALAELNGWGERHSVTVDAQRRFIEDHLGRWAPLFCRSLVGMEDADSFFGAAACLCDEFVALEVAATGAQPRLAMVGRQAPGESETFTCPLATAEDANEEVQP